jgi:hypothetical protein
MSENLPKKYKESFFDKFIQKIKWLFFERKQKNKTIPSNIENISENSKKAIAQNKLIESLKISADSNTNETKDTEFEKKKFMKSLTDNPELLENFSTERLEKILQWYREDNERKSIYLKKLNS